MVKHYRVKKNGTAIWKLLEHTHLKSCPECRQQSSIVYLGFVETYMPGFYAKMYQCQACDAWIDVIWDKKRGRYQENETASV